MTTIKHGAQPAQILEGWTVFDHPSDFPNSFVARRWIAKSDGTVEQTDSVLICPNLDALRWALAANYPHLVPVPRMMRDDPKIVEVWL